ncbi:MAG: hypothetical protein EpisKO_41600 [Epibacterium sp.]
MTDKVDDTASADELSGTSSTDDEDAIWDELEAEEAAANGRAADQDDDQDDFTEEDGEDTGSEDDDASDADDTPDADEEDPEDTDPPEGKADATEDRTEDSTPTLEDLKKHSETLQHKYNSEKNRSAAQQRRADRLQKERDALLKRLEKNKSNDDDTDLDSVSEEYGDVVGPVVNKVKDLTARLNDTAESDQLRIDDINGQLNDIQEEEIGKFEAEHPDGMDVISQNADVFRGWIDDQPKAVRDAYEVNLNSFTDGNAAALVVSRFKIALQEASQQAKGEDTPPADPNPTQSRLDKRRRNQMRGASASRSTSSQKQTGILEPTSDDPDEWWDFWDKQDAKSAKR